MRHAHVAPPFGVQPEVNEAALFQPHVREVRAQDFLLSPQPLAVHGRAAERQQESQCRANRVPALLHHSGAKGRIPHDLRGRGRARAEQRLLLGMPVLLLDVAA